MIIKKITCKTALSPSKLPGLDYSLNPYTGCEHKCAYCYAPNILRMHREDWGNFVYIKENIPLVLSKELKKKNKGVVGISTVTDPYQPVEKKYQLTKFCLQQLLDYDFPISIQTKSSLIERDIELIKKFSESEILITISTLNDYERKLIEPNSSPIQERLMVLKKIADSGLKTSIFFGPIYPSITANDIPQIIDTFVENNVSKIMIDNLHLKPGVWDSIKNQIVTDQNLINNFSKNLFENNNHFMELRKEIIKVGNGKKIKIVDAF